MDDLYNTYNNSSSSFTSGRKSRFNLNFKKLFPNRSATSAAFTSFSRPQKFPLFKGAFKRISKKGLILTGVILLIMIGLAMVFKYSIDALNNSAASGDQKIRLPNAKATRAIGQEFTFPLKNDKGEEVSKFKFILENAELRDEIVNKGQKVTAVAGRIFLIINLKVINDHNQTVQINTRDYIRLTLNNKPEEMLAPDIHNDPVEVQALSTKYTRLGFFINDNDKSLKLHIGEIKGDKTVVDINF